MHHHRKGSRVDLQEGNLLGNLAEEVGNQAEQGNQAGEDNLQVDWDNLLGKVLPRSRAAEEGRGRCREVALEGTT
jgi:hypothetical protein